MNRRVALAAVAAVTLAAVSAWFSRNAQREPSKTSAAQRHIVDYRMHEFTATYMDTEGRPKRRLQAADMVHFADDDTTEVSRPRITLYRPGATPWQVSAGHGHISPGGKEITLNKGVRAHHNDPSGGWVEVFTRDMRVRPDDHYAETNSPVTIAQSDSVVRAVGMRAYMQSERLILLSEVHGRYDPPPR